MEIYKQDWSKKYGKNWEFIKDAYEDDLITNRIE